MAAQRTQQPFTAYVARLIETGEWNVRRLAQASGVDRGHLYRVIHGRGGKVPAAALTGKVALALGVPEDFFPEYRIAAVVERLTADPELLDRLYDELR